MLREGAAQVGVPPRAEEGWGVPSDGLRRCGFQIITLNPDLLFLGVLISLGLF